MVTLEKLGVLGIRSFSPESLEVLSFEKPLTLIVGHNGSGKTTLVECLKMAITGEFPPNANKGQNFIHHVNTQDTPDVKGQIRLVFKSPHDKKILVNRSFQLSSTRDRKGRIKTSFKALESVLQVKDRDGAVRSINKKCAQMDQHVCRLMGVGPAILEHVIFCHQEDSYWPLGDMSTLKKRFDEIFGATRYSKALGVLSTLRKEHQKLMKEKQHELTLTESLQDQAKTLKEKIHQASQKNQQLATVLKSLKQDYLELQDRLLLANQQVDIAKEYEMKRHFTLQELTKGRVQYEEAQRQCCALMQQYGQSTEEALHSEKEALNQRLLSQQSKVSETKKEIHAAEARVEELTQRQKQMICEKEQRLVWTERCESIKTQQERLLKRLVEEDPAIPLTHSVDQIVSWLREAYDTTKTHRVTYQMRSEKERKEKLKELEDSRRSVNHMIESRNTLELQAQELRRDQTKLEELKSEEVELKKRLESLTLHIKELMEQHSRIGISDMECSLETLRQERNEFHNHFDTWVSEALRKKDTKGSALPEESQDMWASTLLNRCSAWYSQLFQKTLLDPRDALQDTSREISRLDQVTTELGKTESILFHHKGILESQQDLISFLEERYGLSPESGCWDRSKTLNEQLFQEMDKTKQALKQWLVTQCAFKFYTKHLKQSLETKECFFCLHPFQDSPTVSRVQSNIETRALSLEEKIKEHHEAFLRQEAHFHQVEKEALSQSLQYPLWEILSELRKKKKETEIKCTQFNLKVQMLHKKREKERERKEDVGRLHQVLKLLCDAPLSPSCAALSQDTHSENQPHTLLQLRQQLVEKDTAIEKLEKELTAKRQSLEDSRHALGLCKERREHVIQQLQSIREAIVTKSTSVTLMDHNREEMQSVLSQIDEETRRGCALQEEQDLQRDRTSQELQRLHAREALLWRHLEDAQGLEKEYRAAHQTLQTLNASFQKEGVDSTMFDRAMRDLGEKRHVLTQQETELQDTQHQMKAVEQALHLVQCRKSLQLLENDLQSVDAYLSDEHHQVQYLNDRVASYTNEMNQLSSKIGMIYGEEKSNLAYQRENEAELQSVRYHAIEKKYRDTLAEYETEAMTVRDLQRYYTALDRALMKYHTLKMQAINQTMRELWQAVYKGKDIDFIMIRSDTEEESQNTSAGQRSYNYRVMMMKDGCHELEMRGRCSAGQKVVASLVIRLALAESFGVNCGIFALDEPTTNLDERNMQGLARALADLIHLRKNCSNFQLILITHDENFVRMLARYQPCESFFQIFKNNTGDSCIRRTDIHSF